MANNTFCTANHILVGLGGTGGKILREFKMRMFEEFPTAEERKLPVALLYVDSTDEMMPKDGRARADFRVMGQDASFTPKEFLNIKAVDVEHILDHIGNYPAVKGIVENAEAVRSAIGSLGQAAGQKRRAGRLLFAANAVAYVNALKDAYARCEAISGDANKKYIYIFAGLCGGTGSGSVVDALLQARKTFPDAIISVYCMIPEMNLPKSNMDQGRYYQNGYAAINELNAIQAGRYFPQDVTGTGPISKSIYTDAVHGVANGLTVYTQTGAQAQVNNLSNAMQMAELEAQLEQEALEEQMLLADLECQAEQDAVLDQMMLEELAYEAEQEAIADAMYIEELAYEAELDAIADAMYIEELAYEEELAIF